MSSLRKCLLSRGAPRDPKVPTPRTRLSILEKDRSPVKWSKYFENEREIHVNDNVFHVHLTGASGPVLVMIHGGGYSALTWALFTEEITKKIECQVLAVDLRGHGNTCTTDEENLALDVLAEDVASVLKVLYGENGPPVVLIGHSLGGAIAVAASALIPSVIGVCVIDVVEGTALESLSSMQSILRGRPANFTSIEHAITWCFTSGQTHNLEAARVSMPGQIKNITTGELAANESETANNNVEDTTEPKPAAARFVHQRSADAIEEENEDEEESEDARPAPNVECGINADVNGTFHVPNLVPTFRAPIPVAKYTWRIDLSKTEPFWNGWFKGLSQKFLDIPVPKVLLLANIHGLDTALTVGQMQGKFQLQVLPRSGHAIHEDQPQQVADIIAGFLVKQKLTVSKNGFTPTMPAC